MLCLLSLWLLLSFPLPPLRFRLQVFFFVFLSFTFFIHHKYPAAPSPLEQKKSRSFSLSPSSGTEKPSTIPYRVSQKGYERGEKHRCFVDTTKQSSCLPESSRWVIAVLSRTQIHWCPRTRTRGTRDAIVATTGQALIRRKFVPAGIMLVTIQPGRRWPQQQRQSCPPHRARF